MMLPTLLYSAILVLAQQSGTLTHTSTTRALGLPRGWQLAVAKGAHLSMKVAPGWKAVDMTADEMEAGGDMMARSNPGISEEFADARRAIKNKEVKMLILHPRVAGSPFVPNINIIESILPEGVSENQAIQISMRDLNNLCSNVHGPYRESTAMGRATVFTGEQYDKVGGKPVRLMITVYTFFKHPNLLYATASLPYGSGLGGVAARMLRTLRATK